MVMRNRAACTAGFSLLTILLDGGRGRALAVSMLLACVLLPACTTNVRHLHMLPLNHSEVVAAAEQTETSLLLHPFEDLRGGTFSHIFATTFIPVVQLFHLGGSSGYPEMTGILRSSDGGRAVATVGSLPVALPYLLANMIREMRLTSSATPLTELNNRSDARRFNWHVRGRVLRTHFASHGNIVPLGLLGILGVPFNFVRYDMEYEVQLFARDDPQPVFVGRYPFAARRAVGLYYNLSAYHDLVVDALESTLPRVVRDLAVAIHRAEASADPRVSRGASWGSSQTPAPETGAAPPPSVPVAQPRPARHPHRPGTQHANE